MSGHIDKSELISKLQTLEGLTNDERSNLIGLLRQHKKYGLVWEDKPEDVEERLREELPVLREVKDKEILGDSPDAPNHILIEGDNLEALTALSYTHEGKIGVIYIDPPYNTGNKDFVYYDDFEDEYRQIPYVDKEDSYRHSKWLSFMSKRLKIAKKLLTDNGVIYISIDDNEQANLKLLCDGVFGETNFVGLMTLLSNPRGSQNSKNLSYVHEYVLMYAKRKDEITIKGVGKDEDSLAEFKEIDDNGRRYRLLGLRKRGGAWKKEDRPNMFYPIYINPRNGCCSLERDDEYRIEVIPKRPTGELSRWTWGREKFLEEKKDVIGKKINRASEPDAYDIFRKDYIDSTDGEEKLTKLKTIWVEKETNYQNARNELGDIFGSSEIFDYPKPTYIIKRLTSIFDSKAATILDFFAGSGTTLHATMQLNAEDGGRRQCILVTNNENNICEEVTYERNKRVIKGYTTPKGVDVEGLKANTLRYYKTDFIPRERTQKNMRDLVAAATDLLCIKEDLYEEQKTFGRFKLRPQLARYFNNGRKHMLIIYREELVDEIAEEIKTLDFGTMRLKIYVFSPGRYAFTDNFYEVEDKVELVALPAAIYDAYQKVLPKRKEKLFEEEKQEAIFPKDLFAGQEEGGEQ